MKGLENTTIIIRMTILNLIGKVRGFPQFTKKVQKIQVTDFLIKFAGMSLRHAKEYAKNYPESAMDFAHKLKMRLLADKGISEETKEKLREYDEF